MIEITEDNYAGVLNTLVSFAKSLLFATRQIDLGEMRTICARFEALGPVLEPTAYRSGGDLNLHDQAAFLEAVDDFVTALHQLDRRTTEETDAP